MQPEIRRLFKALLNYEGRDAFRDVLQPSILPLARFSVEFDRYRSLATSFIPDRYPSHDETRWALSNELHMLYALSRIADMLLLPWQPPAGEDGWTLVGLAPDDLLRFFLPLGMEPIPSRGFSPFSHEVVEAIEDPSLGSRVVIEEEVWPGLMFGAMMFVRAGVRVRCSRSMMDPKIAGRTTLYFTYARQYRPVADLSDGWGSGSQWATDFRCDYAEGGSLHYNVNGTTQLTEHTAVRGPGDDSELQDDLTPSERIELLTHRCFVRTVKPDDDRWPYKDRYTEIEAPG